MLDFTALAIRDLQKEAEMFTEDGTFEMPYLSTFEYATEYRGREGIAGFFRFVRDLYPDFEFENVQVSDRYPGTDLRPNTSSLRVGQNGTTNTSTLSWPTGRGEWQDQAAERSAE